MNEQITHESLLPAVPPEQLDESCKVAASAPREPPARNESQPKAANANSVSSLPDISIESGGPLPKRASINFSTQTASKEDYKPTAAVKPFSMGTHTSKEKTVRRFAKDAIKLGSRRASGRKVKGPGFLFLRGVQDKVRCSYR